MSRYDYERSRQLVNESFASLIMAAIRKADTDNYRLLRAAFPEIADELQARYDATGGFLDGERVVR